MGTTRLSPYLRFQGNARDAMSRYQEVFGGELRLSTFGEFGQAGTPFDDQVMHAQLETPGGMLLMASDTPPGMGFTPGDSISVTLSGDDDAELRSFWDGLAEGGAVDVPLETQMWGDAYGALTDRFGVAWQVNISGSGQA